MRGEEETATFGGGCFWCTEAAFRRIRGVISVVSGYAGGSVPDPTYEMVCSDRTGHAECVKITFDPAIISYRDLLTVFFTIHDPTTPNRQGADVGTQYRSIIFYHSEEQKREAEEFISSLERDHAFSAPVVTELKPFSAFYRAEEYHQNYYSKHPDAGYCRAVIGPKIGKMKKSVKEWVLEE